MKRPLKDDFPNLCHILGAYLHQDYVIHGGTLEDAVLAFVEVSSPAELSNALKEIKEFGDRFEDVEILTRLYELNEGEYSRYFGLTGREDLNWLSRTIQAAYPKELDFRRNESKLNEKFKYLFNFYKNYKIYVSHHNDWKKFLDHYVFMNQKHQPTIGNDSDEESPEITSYRKYFSSPKIRKAFFDKQPRKRLAELTRELAEFNDNRENNQFYMTEFIRRNLDDTWYNIVYKTDPPYPIWLENLLAPPKDPA